MPHMPESLKGLRVLVCGGRDFGEVPLGCPHESRHHYEKIAARQRELLHATLTTLKVDHGISAIIHGAARGADSEAGYWARRQLLAEEPFPADWKRDGKAAGPIRNARMLAEANVDLVVAFPGGRGTADMVRRAKAAGIKVIEVSP